ncbi:MAG: hypothetical protein J6M12_05790 [Clostridia bacterium]|nr:hypothetical protein [Clostridia bacterium]
MKRITAGILLLLCLFGTLSFSSSANLPGMKYTVIWSYGTVGEYYLDPLRYAEGEVPKVPEGITPTKEEEHRLFHFIGWDRAPEPVKKDTVYYAVYRVAEKKYAMDFDTQVTVTDATTLLLHLENPSEAKTMSSPDVTADGTVSIKDVTSLLRYLEKGEQPEISGKTLLEQAKQ